MITFLILNVNSLVLFLNYFFIFLSMCLWLKTVGQNLVPNGDFETYTECPDNLDQLLLSNGWYPYWGTPDYYNACDETQLVGTPLNQTHGYQSPRSGDGYGGLIGLTYNNLKEIMGIELSEPLIVGQEYYIEFYWSRTFGGLAHVNCDCANSHLGALLTTQAFDNVANPVEPFNFAHVYDDNLLEDTVGWNQISGWITADSAYSHLAIGNFFDLALNEVAYYNGSSEDLLLKTYYYIEDVCVATDPAFCNNTLNTLEAGAESFRLLPNPARDQVRIQTEIPIEKITLYDVNGKVLMQGFSPAELVDISNLPSGLYLLEIKTNRGIFREKLLKIP